MKDFRAERGVALACLLLGLCVADTWAAYGPAKAGGSGQGVIIGADPEDVEANPVPHGGTTLRLAVPAQLYPTDIRYPFLGQGTCFPAVKRGDVYDVRCLGPEEFLTPGQVKNALALLPSPYLHNGLMVVINQTTQMIDSTGRPVPLSEVYMHHYVGATTMLIESGAEMRGRMTREPLKWPYALVVDTESLLTARSRVFNIYLISTKGVLPGKDIDRCLQCPCDDDPNRGGFSCCKTCNTTTPGPAIGYRFEYNVTYRPLLPEERPRVKGVDLMWYDITGNEDGIEYQILDTSNTTHIKTYETTADADCPQQEEFEIVRCVGHQHIGSRCITLFNAETDEKICQSCPVYGNVTGEAGNEKGYVVKMTDDTLATPYKIMPGTRVRLESAYDGTSRRTGVMGLMHTWVAGVGVPCQREYGYNHYAHWHRYHRHPTGCARMQASYRRALSESEG